MAPIRPLFLPAAVALGAALALTGCQSDGSSSDNQAASGSPVQSGGAAPASGGTTAAPATGQTGTPGAASAGTKSGSATPAAGTNTDDYAQTHPCAADTISVQVKAMAGAATQRLIEVRNTGAASCGLDYYPLVDLGSAASADRSKNLKPVIPGGLGGAPAYPLKAGATAYAVLDLNPANATAGTAAGIDEIRVLASADLPNAATVSTPLNGTRVLNPKLGLYSPTPAEAATSAKQATMPMPS